MAEMAAHQPIGVVTGPAAVEVEDLAAVPVVVVLVIPMEAQAADIQGVQGPLTMWQAVVVLLSPTASLTWLHPMVPSMETASLPAKPFKTLGNFKPDQVKLPLPGFAPKLWGAIFGYL